MEEHQILVALNNKLAQNQEHQTQEWKQPVTGEETNFIVALSKNTINKSTVEELKQVLRLVMVKVGLRGQNFPNDLEKQILIEHIINHYGNHTPDEVKLAFDMAISDKLELDQKEVVCYENFSCLYFSKIMNAYRKWASETHSQLKKDFPKMIEEKVTLSDEEKAEWLMEWKSMESINIELIPLLFYDFISDKKIIQLSKEQKWDYTVKATQDIKTKLMEQLPLCKTNDAIRDLAKFENMEKDGFVGEFKNRILNRAKRLIIYDYLTDKIK